MKSPLPLPAWHIHMAMRRGGGAVGRGRGGTWWSVFIRAYTKFIYVVFSVINCLYMYLYKFCICGERPCSLVVQAHR